MIAATLNAALSARGPGWTLIDPLEDQRRVDAAKPERIAQYHVDVRQAANAGDVVQIAVGGRVLEVQGRRQPVIRDCQRRRE